MSNYEQNNTISRISMTLPEAMLTELDEMVVARGFDSRSQAIADILHHSLVEHKRELGDDVMVGTITLLYRNAATGLQKLLADIQASHIDEVISSLHVHLQDNKTMEVILVQGPASMLQQISDELTSCRGVICGRMLLMAAMIPQLHPFAKKRKRAARKK
jgi:CopG family transcriptional regulator, nickel-responsive regulator